MNRKTSSSPEIYVRGRAIAAARKVRELRMVASALASTSHPVLVRMIPAHFAT